MGPIKGKVYLVGAGPGDPGLLTIKAARLIREADVIVYDYLTNPAHLRWAKKEAKIIAAGKGLRHRLISQEKINRLILEAAKKGKTVLRLKGGDPYLFGRGGEEALTLFKHRIPFEIVPGVTSATACAAYAGVPLTHRDHNASVTFLTGHRAHDKKLDSIDWKKITGLGGTLVIYMGFYNLGIIAKRLIENGMRASTPVAVVEWGTLPRQRSCEGTLATIERKVKNQGFGAPCIIIVGEVVSLRRSLNWYEKLPLFGKKIIVTRMKEKAGALSSKLQALGAQVIELPVIEIQPAEYFGPMDRAIRRIGDFDWLIFTSTYGVEAFFERLLRHHKKDARILNKAKIAVVGPESAKALERYGPRADLFPKRFETAGLVAEFKNRFKNLNGKKILLLRAQIAPPALELALGALGAEVTRVTAYQTLLSKKTSPQVNDALKSAANFVTFTSSSTVENFVRIIGLPQVRKLAKLMKFASIGPVTSKTLRHYGLRPACQAKIFTVDGLVQCLRDQR